MPGHTGKSRKQGPSTPLPSLGQILGRSSPAGHPHRQVQVAVLVGDAAGEAGQTPVGHALGTEETAAAGRPCRGTGGDAGLGVGAGLLPTSPHT